MHWIIGVSPTETCRFSTRNRTSSCSHFYPPVPSPPYQWMQSIMILRLCKISNGNSVEQTWTTFTVRLRPLEARRLWKMKPTAESLNKPIRKKRNGSRTPASQMLSKRNTSFQFCSLVWGQSEQRSMDMGWNCSLKMGTCLNDSTSFSIYRRVCRTVPPGTLEGVRNDLENDSGSIKSNFHLHCSTPSMNLVVNSSSFETSICRLNRQLKKRRSWGRYYGCMDGSCSTRMTLSLQRKRPKKVPRSCRTRWPCRIGKLHTAHGVLETPALLQVINQNVRTIEPRDVGSIRNSRLITNSYVIWKHDDWAACVEGVHDLINFPGVIMTDSYLQSYVCGDVEVGVEEIVEFQRSIGWILQPCWMSLVDQICRKTRCCKRLKQPSRDAKLRFLLHSTQWTNSRRNPSPFESNRHKEWVNLTAVHPIGGIVQLWSNIDTRTS